MSYNSILLCLNCSVAKPGRDGCDACGLRFEMDGQTPMLFSSKHRSYKTRYVPLQEVEANLQDALSFQAATGADPDAYHLDKGHTNCLKSLDAGSTVLEVGCGGAQMRTYLQGLGHTYFGTDISKTRVSADLQKYGGPDFLSDVHNLPVYDGVVDVVYAVAVVEHLACPLLAAQEIFRVLKPGGLFLGNCSFMEPWHDESFFHMSPNGAAALLLQAGFEIDAMWPSKNYSGYQSLLAMGSQAMKPLVFLGEIMRHYNSAYYKFKGLVRRDTYSLMQQRRDLAITAGAIDWVAQKPSV